MHACTFNTIKTTHMYSEYPRQLFKLAEDLLGYFFSLIKSYDHMHVIPKRQSSYNYNKSKPK